MKQKCYIAGKIGGMNLSEFMPLFEKGKEDVSILGYEPVSPTDLPHDHDKTVSSYLNEDFSALLSCQAIYLLSNYKDSPGALKEFALATWTNKKIIFQ